MVQPSAAATQVGSPAGSPPFALNSMKMSKKLLLRQLPSGQVRMLVFPKDPLLGLSRSMTPGGNPPPAGVPPPPETVKLRTSVEKWRVASAALPASEVIWMERTASVLKGL